VNLPITIFYLAIATAAFALIAALLGCVDTSAVDSAIDRAAKIGGCLRVVCEYPPVECAPSAGSCQ
jgi:hypothetical protein